MRNLKDRVLNSIKGNKKDIKISVVVPTYNTEIEGLKNLMASIDKQTMNKDEYELVFVDDGSTTDTYERLQEFAKARSNMTVKQIENSGWGSRPRNIATQMAKGEYILYLDHDDTVFPEAFERVYNFGKENNLDVVSGKEVRTNGWSWGWKQFSENNPHAEEMGIECLLPMTPHKFYKREFLLEHDITFDDGARVLWEDVYFNSKAFIHGAKVGILADYPTYYWIATGANNSSSFGRDPHEKWNQINKLFNFFKDNIKEQRDLDFMLTHWYRSRVLGILGQWLLKNNNERIDIEFNYARKLAEELIPAYISDNLDKNNQVKDHFLRLGDLESLKKLAKIDAGITSLSYVDDAHFEEDKLVFKTVTKMTYEDKEDFLIKKTANRMERILPDEIKAKLPEAFYDYSADLSEFTYEPSIKGRNSRATWKIDGSTSKVEVVNKKDDLYKVEGEMTFSVQIDDYILDAADKKQPWDIATRFTGLGYTSHRALTIGKILIKTALVNGKTMIVYKNASGLISLDVNSSVRSIVEDSGVKHDQIVTDKAAGKITIPLKEIHVFGESNVEGTAELVAVANTEGDSITLKARLVGEANEARVEVLLGAEKLAGEYHLVTNIQGKKDKQQIKITL
ncbi:glycosyltransferase family 2 protein [Listeria seeligeri]|uniref:glycosyltransferase family 2 protein n=1 Tax=Listeria seeligeri TaxID=1640 RepID=UPI00162689CC|nr:glycosyltransferase [Listeria seeligeri]MBC1421757.1 glycosyltransferase [Listeria seeligeri]MBC1751441.1 glycosyltransferase [Listeria seeligeri]MBC1824014.1 glycosyltransferase [Listeria seeligeri]MBC1829699.1 glycosyltransferase [Listeria seeligeri]MBC1838053.1 glycosyltransferase [Listeria seeligeri]